jgi:glucokinase
MTSTVGIDIGGTFIKAALVSGEGRVLRRARVASGVEGGADEIERRVEEAVGELGGGGIRGVGIGVPGMVRMDDGVVVRSPNIPAWNEYPARERLGARLGLGVVVDNDANMAALGEGWVGAGRGAGSFMMITLGTGIGAGIVLGGRLWHGDTGRAGEFGHVIVEPGGAPCGCGGRGCVERYASADGMRRLASELGLEADVPDIMALAGKGDPAARRVFETAGGMLGIALGAWFNIMDVRTVIVGGGAAPALRLMLPHLRDALARSVYGVEPGQLRIVPAELGEEAGVIGSARSAMLAAGILGQGG